jgi:hypothetical protein
MSHRDHISPPSNLWKNDSAGNPTTSPASRSISNNSFNVVRSATATLYSRFNASAFSVVAAK